MGDLVSPYVVKKGREGNTILFYNFDCLDGMNGHIKEKSVDIVVTQVVPILLKLLVVVYH